MPPQPGPQTKLPWLVLLLALSLPLLACRLLVNPTPAPGATRPTGRVLFSDDFSDPYSGWNQVTAPGGESIYLDGAYRIFVNQPNVDIWSKPGKTFRDVRLEVDAYKVGGERDNRFGLICRAVDDDSFYTFIVSSDGYYGIGLIDGQEYQLLGMDALQPSDAIHLGSASNHIRADCVGDTLTLTVNGVQLAQVKDTRFLSGDVGLIAGTYATPGTDIRFDDFVVYQP
ncbi:MAG: hypothetical protein A2W35_03725 [Chloroflexi bacterium RBG_16_57_11]|nr:MAG: hypothetical protein A2W35_03725 [Chloroflexi bacterium RBG_16_57_11]